MYRETADRPPVAGLVLLLGPSPERGTTPERGVTLVTPVDGVATVLGTHARSSLWKELIGIRLRIMVQDDGAILLNTGDKAGLSKATGLRDSLNCEPRTKHN